MGLFLVSGVLRLIIVLSVFPRNCGDAEEDISEAAETKPASALYATIQYTPSRFSLYYHPEYWGEYVRPSVSPFFNKVVIVSDKLAPKGIFYHPEDWLEYKNPHESVKFPSKVVPPLSGLYYHPDRWREYIKHTSVRKPAVCRYDVEKLTKKPLEVILQSKTTSPIRVAV